ncbi:hypothetical protein DFLDMN_001502 [Cupriavidus sp. H19C3]|uniref:HNH endonuclease n=1 Tax=Cupriavidus sp. H19C3 TaxID=3241603 RepID=UPI003BF877FC
MNHGRTRKADLTQEEVRRLLDYDKDTGIFRWRERPTSEFATPGHAKMWNTRFSGKQTGCIRKDGYVVIILNYQSYLAHRLAWMHANGPLNGLDIDHINGSPTDNRLANLRLVSAQENQRNLKMPVTNRSGVNGVSWSDRYGKWVAQISVGGRSRLIGRYRDMADAVNARKQAETEHGYHANHGRTA